MDNAFVGAHSRAPLPADRASPAPPAIADFACQISLESQLLEVVRQPAALATPPQTSTFAAFQILCDDTRLQPGHLLTAHCHLLRRCTPTTQDEQRLHTLGAAQQPHYTVLAPIPLV